MKTFALFVTMALTALFFIGCTPVVGNYMSTDALTLQQPQPIEPSLPSMDIPKKFFDEILPSKYHYNGIGIINNQLQFQRLWALYSDQRTALPQIIDFEQEALIFVYDPNYYNFIRICGIDVYQGIAEIAIEKTKWELAIGGNPDARRYREAIGEPTREPIVNVSFLRVPRNQEMQRGVTAVVVEVNAEDKMKSRVIPISSHP